MIGDEANDEVPVPDDDLFVAGWQVHASSNRISKDGETVKLEPRTMAVLLYLAATPDEVITRERLEQDVWQGVVVGYDALNNTITKLRKAFNDDRRNARIIETVPKVGYRLIGEVRHAPPAPEIDKPEHKLERKLAAILYADVAGYSRLTGEDEEGTHRVLSTCLDAIAEGVRHHNGTVVHYAGDAVLAEFPTVLAALSCAVAVQRELAGSNAGRPADRSVEFRMGINLGDVIVDREDIYGDGVNVAARLESLADPGGICISESVHSAIGHKLPLGYEFLGEQSVKNIAEPVRAYRVLPEGQQPHPHSTRPRRSSPMLVGTAIGFFALVAVLGVLRPWQGYLEREARPPLRPDKPSIVVLPIANMSDELTLEHFADGITDDLITDLSRISGLFVTARHSAFTYKDQSISIPDIAAELGVRYVLAGSIRNAGEQLRLNIQFIDSTTDGQLWAERYETSRESIFGVQEQVIQKVVAALAVELTDTERSQLARIPTTSLEAYDYYLRAERRMAVTNVEADEINEILALYRRALNLDPAFNAARIGVARAAYLTWRWDNARVMPTVAARQLAYESASQVLAAEPDNPDAYALLALLQAAEGELRLAEESARKAVVLNVNDAELYRTLARVLRVAGRHTEALAVMETAFSLDPKPPVYFHGELGQILYFDGQYERALVHLEKTWAECVCYRTYLVATYTELGRTDDAQRTLATRFAENDVNLYNLTRLRAIRSNYQEKDLDRLIRSLAKAGVPQWPYGFEPDVTARLDMFELETLSSNRTWNGHDYDGIRFVQHYLGDGRVAFRSEASLLSGNVQLRDDLLCISYPAQMLGREDCGHVYRQTSGSSEQQNEYAYVTLGQVYFFSVSP